MHIVTSTPCQQVQKMDEHRENDSEETYGLFGSPGFHCSFRQSQRPESFICVCIAGSAPRCTTRIREAQKAEVMDTFSNGTGFAGAGAGAGAVTVALSILSLKAPESCQWAEERFGGSIRLGVQWII